MKDEFPTLLYKCPGAWLGPPGFTFSTLPIRKQESLDAALKEGWFKTVPEAVEAYKNKDKSVDDPVSSAPPTREEMFEQAKLLKIRVDHRWSNQKLLAVVNAAYKETK